MHRTKLIAWLLAALMIVSGSPSIGWAASGLDKISDSSSEGAVITVGLFITVLAVLFIVGFKSDVENVFSHRGEAATLVQSMDGSSLEAQPSAAGSTGLGLRLTF